MWDQFDGKGTYIYSNGDKVFISILYIILKFDDII